MKTKIKFKNKAIRTGVTIPRGYTEEDLLQISFCKILDLCKDLDYYAIPNGGHRAKSVGALLKKTGTKPGVPDLHIPVAFNFWREGGASCGCSDSFHSLYIETKTPTGIVSKDQKKWHDKLIRNGNYVTICRNVNQLLTDLKLFYPEQTKHIRL